MKSTTIHFRINLLLLGIGVVFLILLLTLIVTTYNQEKLIMKESKLQFHNEVISLAANKTELLKQVAFDYTFWNEFIDNLNVEKDTAWYSNNITTILKSFRVDYVSAYDSSYQLVHEFQCPLSNQKVSFRKKPSTV
jgi:sensor domain CHASE-containing protein